MQPSPKASPEWRIASRIVDDALHFGQALYRQIWVLLVLVAVGLALDTFRIEIIWLSPFFTKHYAAFVKVWNIIGEILGIVISFMEFTFGGVIKGLHAVGFARHISTQMPGHDTFHTLSNVTHDFDEIFIVLPKHCSKYSSAYDIVDGTFDRLVGKHVCWVMRALYPTPPRGVSKSVLLWAAHDRSYVPDGFGNGNGDCSAAGEPMLWLCTPFGAGAIILELVVPVILAAIAIISFRHLLFIYMVNVVTAPVTWTGDVIMATIKSIAEHLHIHYPERAATLKTIADNRTARPRLPEPPRWKHQCPYCHEPVRVTGSAYCDKCGARLPAFIDEKRVVHE